MTTQPAPTPLRVAVVGSGPSGFYAAEHLQAQEGQRVQVDMFDRLPTPFGLVRGGVAPDHQKIKSVTRVYDRIASHPAFRFYGNVEIGRDLTRTDLLAYYHAVVYAVGARADRRMGIPGEHLPGSHSATELVGWYNAHPDFRSLSFDLSGTSAVVVGNGNVAMDVARILATPVTLLAATDIAEHALDALAESRIEEIYLLGRRGPAQAAFTPKELRELGELPGVSVEVDPAQLELDPASARQVATAVDRNRDRNLEVLRGFAGRRPAASGRRVRLRFLCSPVAIEGTERVERVLVARNEIVESDDGRLRARPTPDRDRIDTNLVFRAIGYTGEPLLGLPFDSSAGVIPNAKGRILTEDGAVAPGEYVSGWIKRGPQGVIGTNKPDALETVTCLLEDLEAGRLERDDVPPRPVLERLVRQRRSDFVTYEDWQLIDTLERQRGRDAGDRPRVKFSGVEEMLRALAEHKDAQARPAP